MGAVTHRIRTTDLETMYANNSANTITIGKLTQDSSVVAKINFDKLMSRHFAVVGSTGVGKSSAVSLILRKIIEHRPEMRVMILDPHNEFGSAFTEHAAVTHSNDLHLPFWLFMFDELREVVFRGQRGLNAESELLRDLVSEAKERYQDNEATGGVSARRVQSKAGYTANSPVPFRLADLYKIVDERLGLLEGKSDKPVLKALRDRLVSISNDPRFAFAFDNANGGADRMSEVIGDLFRIPQSGRPISVVDLSGIPSEVVNSVASVLCRLSFDLAVASQGAIQTLVVCEEAHRYIPADPEAGFSADPPGHRQNSQGGTQIRRLSRHHHATAERTRPDNLLAMQHRVRHAACQPARPADHRRRDDQRRADIGELPFLGRQSRVHRIRRSTQDTDAADVRDDRPKCPARPAYR